VYGLAPALAVASRPVGTWNTFEIQARAASLTVTLNGVRVSALTDAAVMARRRPSGYIGLQAHHPGSRVRFRNIQIRRC
jgi:hypothetical protein